MLENDVEDPFRTWRMTIDERWDQWEETNIIWIDSSPAWRHFEGFLAGHGYQICYYFATSIDKSTRPRSPECDFDSGLGDPFKPSVDSNRPFVFHDPKSQVYERSLGIWNTNRPRVTYAYDKYNRIVVIKAVPIPDPSSEVELLVRLNDKLLRSCSDNHTIPLLAHLVSNDGWQFLVMPAWRMSWTDCYKIWQVDEYFAILIQSLKGLAFLHKNGIAHMDINPENIVFNQDGSLEFDYPQLEPVLSKWDFRIAFIDFGLSVQFDPSVNSKPVLSVSLGSPGLIAPENEAADTTRNEYQILPADVYSLAATYKERLDREENIVHLVRSRNHFPTYAHDVLKKHIPEFFEILNKMMHVEPSKRPTAAEALQLFKELREKTPKYIRFASHDGYPGEILLL